MATQTVTPKILNILWMAFLNVIFLYVLVAAVSVQPAEAPPETSTIRIVLTGIGIAMAMMSFVWHRVVAFRPDTPTYLLAHETATATEREAARSVSEQRLLVNCIITWALSEGVALLGLVLAFLSQSWSDVMPFAGAGVALMVVHRPATWPLDRIFAAPGSSMSHLS